MNELCNLISRDCGNFMSEILTTICVHEHLVTEFFCDECITIVRDAMSRDDWICKQCSDIDGHTCVWTELVELKS